VTLKPSAATAEILSRFRCPTCRSPVTETDGGLRCDAGHVTPVRHGYVDASGEARDETTARTFESFGYEWTAFGDVRDEDQAFWSTYFRDVPLAELAGKRGLDAGCGKGRYTRLTAPHLGSLVALDGSEAVEAAARNLADLDNVVVVKADLRDAPFEPHSFDFISCLGVLHHLSEPEQGLRDLVKLLADGGRMLVYLYSRPEKPGIRSVGLAASAGFRRLSLRVPHRVLRPLSAPLAAALYAGVVVPGQLGSRLGIAPLARLPLHTYRGRPWRSLWLDTFDRLSAPVENRYIWSELKPWFERAGLTVEAVREDAGYFIVARKPSPAPDSSSTARASDRTPAQT
jgi:SAM-dependent methyltransferase